MNSIAIITARGGSKRIPRKNLKIFRGKPIISYSIQAAIESGIFETVMVSTDDEEIAEVSKRYGAKVPFLRSRKSSDDFATTADVIVEVVDEYKKREQSFDYACCIYPTAPMITTQKLIQGQKLLISNNFTSVFPVCAYSHPIYRALRIEDDGKIEMIWPENIEKRSQDLSTAYHDAGQFYWIQVEAFLREKKLFTSNSGALVMKELEVQDIDTETDWKIAELKHKLLFPDEQF